MTVIELNQHPLNQAARRRLAREVAWVIRPLRERETTSEPTLMFLLELAWLGWPEEREGDSPEGLAMAEWSRTVRHQAAALHLLVDDVTPEDLEAPPLAEIADTVVSIVRANLND